MFDFETNSKISQFFGQFWKFICESKIENWKMQFGAYFVFTFKTEKWNLSILSDFEFSFQKIKIANYEFGAIFIFSLNWKSYWRLIHGLRTPLKFPYRCLIRITKYHKLKPEASREGNWGRGEAGRIVSCKRPPFWTSRKGKSPLTFRKNLIRIMPMDLLHCLRLRR